MSLTNLPAKYLTLLACPACRSRVVLHAQGIACVGCSTIYPVVDGIPIMLTQAQTQSTKTSQDSWDQFWDHWGMHPDSNVEGHPYYSKVLEHIYQHGPEGDWGVFLESGCGNGSLSLGVARKKKIPVVGIDFSLEACRCAKRLFEREKEEGFFVVGDIQRLPFGEQVFGYIFAGGSLEHFTDTSIGVKESFRSLRPGGKIYASVPVISLTTLLVYQTWGNIPELPMIRPLAEWLHMKVLKARHMKYGYEKSFTPRGFGKYFTQAGFQKLNHGLFDYNREMRLLPYPWMKQAANRLMSARWFWPMMYLEATR